MHIFQIFLILAFVFCIFVLIKNEMVYCFEIFLIEKCYIAVSNHTSHIPSGSSKEELEVTHCDEMDRVSEFKKMFDKVNTYDSPLV